MMVFLLFLIISKINTSCNNDQLLTEAVAGQKQKCLAQGHRTVPRTSDPSISKVTPDTTTEQTRLNLALCLLPLYMCEEGRFVTLVFFAVSQKEAL